MTCSDVLMLIRRRCSIRHKPQPPSDSANDLSERGNESVRTRAQSGDWNGCWFDPGVSGPGRGACIMQTHSLIVMAPLRVISSPLFDRIVTHYCIITVPATVLFYSVTLFYC